MKDKDFNICPMCEGKLEQRVELDHPKKGIIQDLPHHFCPRCGEIYLSGEAVDLIRGYQIRQQATA